MGTNIACSGVIPFVDILLDNSTTKFKPGKFFDFYTSLLPTEATNEGCNGGFLFQRVKKQCRTFNLHDPKIATLYKPNSKGEKKEGTTFH